MNEYVNGYKDPRWMTFNQASSKGYLIKKGSKGVPIEYWSLYDNKNRKSITSAEAKRIIEEKRKDQKISRISVEFILYLTQHRWKVYHFIKIRIKI